MIICVKKENAVPCSCQDPKINNKLLMQKFTNANCFYKVVYTNKNFIKTLLK